VSSSQYSKGLQYLCKTENTHLFTQHHISEDLNPQHYMWFFSATASFA
jgi:hypothetical protein